MKEKEVIRNLKNGKTEYMEPIVLDYYTEIYHYLCRKLGNEVEAQDVTQEVFIKFFSNIHSYQERGKLKNYLLKLATNASNDMFRKRKSVTSLEEIDDLLDLKLSPLEVVEQREDAERVKRALQNLSVQQREVIILRFYHELPFWDIAKITETNLSTVKTRYRRGMASLKKMLEVEDETES